MKKLFKNKFVVPIILDGIDLFLGIFGVTLNLVIPGFAVGVNNVRDIIWDLLSTPILVSMFGDKGYLNLLETPIPGR